VLERSGLETRVCECYAVVKKELGRLLSDVQYRQGIPAESDIRLRPTGPPLSPSRTTTIAATSRK
jgi:hypothetical protein